MKLEKKTLDHGNVQQNYRLAAKFVKQERDGGVLNTVVTEKIAEMTLESFQHGTMMTLQQIVDFRNGANTILHATKEALKNGECVEIELSVSAHEHVEPYFDGNIEVSLKQLAYDRWSFTGYRDDVAMDPEEGGLHLLPDTKYTDERRDIYILWNTDVMSALAGSGL